jgi:hypothetical protein
MRCVVLRFALAARAVFVIIHLLLPLRRWRLIRADSLIWAWRCGIG